MFSMVDAQRFILQIQGVSKAKLESLRADLVGLNVRTPPQEVLLAAINEELKAIEEADAKYVSKS